jgi:hypothetical protein
LGIEATWGTEVDATIALGSTTITPTPFIQTKQFTPRGRRMMTVNALSREYSTLAFDGVATYTELGYLLKPVVSDVFGDAVAYTVECGDTLTIPGVVVDSWSLKTTNTDCSFSGAMIGKKGTVKTGTISLAPAAQLPILPSQWTVAMAAVTTLKWFDWELSASGLWSPAFYKGMTDLSNIVHSAIEVVFKISVEADTAGLAQLAIRTPITTTLTATGSGTASVILVFDAVLTSVSPFKDDQGIYAYELTYNVMNKATAAVAATIVAA